ncbi:His Kinase A (phospho-acceptor) domain-containing protein [Catalinimonas alkaloidigena]|uniref:histidine kinase n=1 Tax=Catalinimonas alkaloidigena TaxID=1075417 RepID=A0A1G9DZ59_9BACT|nr:ATP-binding protein [Catalinimonas alkaloidigena]SDK69172.1 His Kinase A (phospho-acceptor) domain-containing protein [Catalinimonas alkaloidigena]
MWKNTPVWLRSTLNRQIIIIFSLIVLLVTLGAFSALYLTNYQNQHFAWTKRRNAAQTALESVSYNISKAESELQYYIITGDSSYQGLDMYIEYINRDLKRFEETIDTPKQQRAADSLKNLVTMRMAMLKKTIATRQEAGRTEAQIYLTISKGRYYTQRLHYHIKRMQEAEMALLSQQESKSDSMVTLFKQGSILGGILIIGLSLYAILHVVAEMRRRTRLEKELRERNDNKDKFFSIIGHDLKAPFNSLVGLSQLMLTPSANMSDEERKRLTEMMAESAQRTRRLLENLLSWARIQMDRDEILPVSFDLRELVAEEVEYSSNMAQQKKITLLNKIPANCGAYADRNMIAAAVRNLISNALKFSQTDTEVTVSATRRWNYLEIAVTDQGIGMAPETQAKLFRIEEHLTTKGTQNESGTGLGLILCKEMIERNGGQIWVESQEGLGTTFFFSLPSSSTAPGLANVNFRWNGEKGRTSHTRTLQTVKPL